MQLWQFARRIHASWLLALVSGGIVIGVAVAPSVRILAFESIPWLIVGLLMVAVGLWRRVAFLIPIVMIGGLLVGLWRGSVADAGLAVYQNLHGKSVNVSGTVTDDPDIGKKGETLLRLGDISVDNNPIAGKVWVGLPTTIDIKRGDRVTIGGMMSLGFGGFAGAIYHAKLERVQRPEPGDIARQARDGFAEKVRTAIDDPQASLGLGYLVGQRRALPPELDQALVVAGLTHIVVASGYNLTILVRLARRLFVKISKYLATLSASVMILAFVAVTGTSPSMTRAGLVAGLSLAAWYYGRQFHPLVLLPIAAAITVLINPGFAWNDIGWQLSFAAFAGVMILAPLLQRYFFGDKKPGILRQILGETISASIVTLPILVVAFGQFSNVAVAANLLVLPLVPLAILLTFGAGVGASIAPGIAPLLGVPAELLLSYMIQVAQFFAGLSWAQTTVAIEPWIATAAYGLIIAFCVYLWRITRYDLKQTNIIE